MVLALFQPHLIGLHVYSAFKFIRRGYFKKSNSGSACWSLFMYLVVFSPSSYWKVFEELNLSVLVTVNYFGWWFSEYDNGNMVSQFTEKTYWQREIWKRSCPNYLIPKYSSYVFLCIYWQRKIWKHSSVRLYVLWYIMRFDNCYAWCWKGLLSIAFGSTANIWLTYTLLNFVLQNEKKWY
jgi:hypothetical protein